MTDHELCYDIIEALRHQVMQQNEEINRYRVWIRGLEKWLQGEIREILNVPQA